MHHRWAVISLDLDVWHYNSTPAACTYVALDYVILNFYGNRSIDLYVERPNFRLNPGYLYYTSETVGSFRSSPPSINHCTLTNVLTKHNYYIRGYWAESPWDCLLESQQRMSASMRSQPQVILIPQPSRLNWQSTSSTNSSRVAKQAFDAIGATDSSTHTDIKAHEHMKLILRLQRQYPVHHVSD